MSSANTIVMQSVKRLNRIAWKPVSSSMLASVMFGNELEEAANNPKPDGTSGSCLTTGAAMVSLRTCGVALTEAIRLQSPSALPGLVERTVLKF